MPLKIVAVTSSPEKSLPSSTSKKSFLQQVAQERTAHYDRLWLRSPEVFSTKSALETLRIKRTKEVLQSILNRLKEKNCFDIGCGDGSLSLFSLNQGLSLTACEISKNALPYLDKLVEKGGKVKVDSLPFTKEEDRSYSLILCTEVLQILDPKEYRLSFSELARLLTKEGRVLCSIPLDSSTDDPDKAFIRLASTEFHIEDKQLSYHFLFEKLVSFHQWIQNSSTAVFPIRLLGKSLNFCFSSFFRNILYREKTILFLESLSKKFFGKRAMTHLIYVGKKRSFFS